MLISIGKLSKELGVTPDCIRKWEKKGKISSIKTSGKHRRFDLDKVLSQLNDKDLKKVKKSTLIYARVSTKADKDNLERQIIRLENYSAANGWQYEVISDIGSGLNFNKKGLKDLIHKIESNKYDRLLLNYKDRLLRFGSEIIFEICKLHDVEVIILNQQQSKSFEEELVDDIITIIHVFSSRLYGSRSHKNKKVIELTDKLTSLVKDNEKK